MARRGKGTKTISLAQYRLQLKPLQTIYHNLELGPQQKVQYFVDKTIAKDTEPYVPIKTGALRKSVQASHFGSGLLIYAVPYSYYQYQNGREEGYKPAYPLSGRKWLDRYLRDHRDDLIRKVQAYVDRGFQE